MAHQDSPCIETYLAVYGDMIFRLAYAMTFSKADAEDICQNTFIKLSCAKRRFSNDEHIKHWLIRTAINESKDILRRRKRLCSADSDSLERVPFCEPGYSLFEDAEERKCLHHQLRKILESLQYKYKVILYLRFYLGYDCNDIARLLHRNPSTVRTQLQRALNRVREELKRTGYETFEW